MKPIWIKLCLLVALAAGADTWAQQPVAEAKIYLQNSRLAGFRYYEGRKLWSQMRIGDELELIHEPGNPYDAHAVRVEWRGNKIGYVPRAENAALARFMDRTQKPQARITALPKERPRGRRIEFDVYLER